MVLYPQNKIYIAREVQTSFRRIRERSGLVVRELSERFSSRWDISQKGFNVYISGLENDPEVLLKALVRWTGRSQGYDLERTQRRITDYLNFLDANEIEKEGILSNIRKIQPDFEYMNLEERLDV